MKKIKALELFSSLTESQRAVYEFVKESFYENSSMPTLREICQYMGWTAVGSAQATVQALVDKGFLNRDPLKARGLQLVQAASFRAIPVLGEAPAGTPLEAIESHEGDLVVPDFIRGPVFAIRVRGDSMEDAGIADGDIAIVRQTKTAEHGDIIVALLDGETTIKRLKKTAKGLWLMPENKRYKPRKIESVEFRVLGKVIGLHRYWEGI